MRLVSFFCCILLILPFKVMEAKTSHKEKWIKRWTEPKQRALKPRSAPSENSTSEGSNKHCSDVFQGKDLVAHMAYGMVSEIVSKLEVVCLDSPVHPLVYQYFTDALLCDASLSEAVNRMVDVLYNRVEKSCYDKPGFKGVYVFTTAENELGIPPPMGIKT